MEEYLSTFRLLQSPFSVKRVQYHHFRVSEKWFLSALQKHILRRCHFGVGDNMITNMKIIHLPP